MTNLFSNSKKICNRFFYKKMYVCTFVVASFAVYVNSAYAQVSFVNQGLITNTNSQFVINGDVTNQLEGTITNDGHLYVRGNWTNDNTSSTVFTPGSQGWVHLDSAIQGSQTVGGNLLTHFNKLELSGNGTKQLGTVDVEIEDTLALNNKEFLAGDNTVFVQSPSTTVITRTSGFVSNTNDGGLSRVTNANEVYEFPVGSSVGTLRFRPVEITPATSTTYKVRMANVDATTEGYDITSKETTIGLNNPNFYHRISSATPYAAADVTLYYDPVTDGEYDIMAQWDNLWKNLGEVATTTNYNMNGITKMGYTNFANTPFILSETAPGIFVANVFSPNGDGTNDVLHVLGNGIEELSFTVYSRWGEKVFETTNVNNGWDGTYKGEPMNVGVFVYFITGKFKNGETIDKNGNITLLR
jgi:gliding motility-associated-like protein